MGGCPVWKGGEFKVLWAEGSPRDSRVKDEASNIFLGHSW